MSNFGCMLSMHLAKDVVFFFAASLPFSLLPLVMHHFWPHIPYCCAGIWVMPGSTQNRCYVTYITRVLRLIKPREAVAGNAGCAVNLASIAPACRAGRGSVAL